MIIAIVQGVMAFVFGFFIHRRAFRAGKAVGLNEGFMIGYSGAWMLSRMEQTALSILRDPSTSKPSSWDTLQ